MGPTSPIQAFGPHFPDGHSQTLRRQFRAPPPATEIQALQDALTRLRHLYVLCFTSRSGSHFLGQALASDGRLLRPGETLNADVVLRHAKEQRLRSFEGYLAWLVGRSRGRQGIAGVKASVGQLIALYNSGVLGAMGERLRVIHLVREDVFDQAISLLIASKTRQWASWLGQRAAPPAYNAERLLAVAADLSAQNGAFRTLFRLWGITPCEVRYEALVADPASELARLGDFLGLSDLGFDLGKISCERQAGALNAEYKARLQRDFAIMPGG